MWWDNKKKPENIGKDFTFTKLQSYKDGAA